MNTKWACVPCWSVCVCVFVSVCQIIEFRSIFVFWRLYKTISVRILQWTIKIDLFGRTGQDFFGRCNIPWQEKHSHTRVWVWIFSYTSKFRKDIDYEVNYKPSNWVHHFTKIKLIVFGFKGSYILLNIKRFQIVHTILKWRSEHNNIP